MSERFCNCERYIKESKYDISQCRICWLYHHQPNDIGFVGANQSLSITQKGRCKHLGKATDKTVECDSCNGRVRLKLFECAVYSLCLPGKQIDNIACCIGCDSYIDSMS